ncbi:MAG: lipoprotein-releasing system transmembrane subunit LolC, partial [Candidatus Schekmanbacteria bacterium]
CYVLKNYPFIKIDFTIYYMKTLPIVINPLIFFMVTLYAIAVCIFFSVFPSWQASKQNPVEILRYE